MVVVSSEAAVVSSDWVSVAAVSEVAAVGCVTDWVDDAEVTVVDEGSVADVSVADGSVAVDSVAVVSVADVTVADVSVVVVSVAVVGAGAAKAF